MWVMTMLALLLQQNHTTNYMAVANTKEQHPEQMKRRWIAARTASARKKDTMVKIAVKTVKWIVVRTANARKKATTEKIVVKTASAQRMVIRGKAAAKNLNNEENFFQYEKAIISCNSSVCYDGGERTVHEGQFTGYRPYLCHVQQCYQ